MMRIKKIIRKLKYKITYFFNRNKTNKDNPFIYEED